MSAASSAAACRCSGKHECGCRSGTISEQIAASKELMSPETDRKIRDKGNPRSMLNINNALRSFDYLLISIAKKVSSNESEHTAGRNAYSQSIK